MFLSYQTAWTLKPWSKSGVSTPRVASPQRGHSGASSLTQRLPRHPIRQENHFCAATQGHRAQHWAGAATCLSPRPLVMFTSFSMPPVSASALAFSMFLLVTSCKAQQIAATVSSDNTLGPLPPGSRLTRSRMAYLPRKPHRQNQVKKYILVLQIWNYGTHHKTASESNKKKHRIETMETFQELTFYRESRETFDFFFPFTSKTCKLHFCTKTRVFVNRNYLEKSESFKEKCHTADSDWGVLHFRSFVQGWVEEILTVTWNSFLSDVLFTLLVTHKRSDLSSLRFQFLTDAQK